ncbi:hypothetical protein RF11_14996 [Thelohanellus kitauei]|uniref:Calcineurin-like phosphoesterase domain-containing protein n=1 Tax=Thelohanellus kitauei TaxID=669202 RepID=A0A0C2IEP2_THEKT|nr:hypothetical protein RF11_14996 [Thelohanellus kitauei]
MITKYFLIVLTFKIFHNFSHKKIEVKKEELNIVIVGDIGKSEKKSSIKKNVVAQIRKRHNATPYDLGIVLGDNIYEFGFARDDFTKIKEMFADSFPNDTFKFDFLSLLGNHEYFGDTQTAMKYHEKEPRYYQPDRYYLYSIA